jgi:hypothetical protein
VNVKDYPACQSRKTQIKVKEQCLFLLSCVSQYGRHHYSCYIMKRPLSAIEGYTQILSMNTTPRHLDCLFGNFHVFI